MAGPIQPQHKQLRQPHAWSTRLAPTSASNTQTTPEQPPAETFVEGVASTVAQTSPDLTATAPALLPDQPIATDPADFKASSPEIVTAANNQLDGYSEYVPRPQLSVPPVPQRTAIIVPPSGNYPTDRIVGTLSLYIDETGKVHHILPSGAPMPPEFEEAAKQAFLPLTFRPGILNGVPVKSRIRIEVVFDNTPLPEAPTKPEGSDQRP